MLQLWVSQRKSLEGAEKVIVLAEGAGAFRPLYGARKGALAPGLLFVAAIIIFRSLFSAACSHVPQKCRAEGPAATLNLVEGPGSKAIRSKHLILLPLSLLHFSFAIFCPKIACQAPKPLNPNKTSHIPVAF
jgi:hypothetical protein